MDKNFLQYYPLAFTKAEAEEFFKGLTNNIHWGQESIIIFGRKVLTPRLTAWYGDVGAIYKYSGVSFDPLPWTEELLLIKSRAEQFSGTRFNSVLLNFYRNGNDSMGWHSDDEPELGRNPVIASINFGEARRFDLRSRADNKRKEHIVLENGSILVMRGDLQHRWQHAIAKSAKVKGPRINLTFRMINK
ncbi:MAG TPA: alpha-ketoglutarate-dependent dioxygenase AlkB [Mucilaginibacter sp.]|nr:alpha-ketoglutarate-dependent dioxygenase AlkB [Mucilaginibacter sp.]